jgi:uncharacterized protein
VLGVADASMTDCLREVPTSRSDTGALTRAALYAKGFHVGLVAELADVDTVDDIEPVRKMCATGSRFARAVRAVRA